MDHGSEIKPTLQRAREIRQKPFTMLLFILLLTHSLTTPHACLFAFPVPRRLSFAMIQLEVSDELCSSGAAFKQNIDSILETVLRPAYGETRRDPVIDLVVFPEYTSALLGIAEHLGPSIAGARSLDEALKRIRAGGIHTAGVRIDGESYGTGRLTIPYLLARIEAGTQTTMDTFWSNLAREYRIFIIAGTVFAIDEKSGELRNRAVVYDPTGRRVYEQDKVFLTPFEISILGISPGETSNAKTFSILGKEVALTICRDTFFDTWEQQFAHADIWFDLKANGAVYSAEEARNFATALPERIAHSGVSLGGTVCLTGNLLELHWEGLSSLVVFDNDAAKGFRTVQTPHTFRSFAVILHP